MVCSTRDNVICMSKWSIFSLKRGCLLSVIWGRNFTDAGYGPWLKVVIVLFLWVRLTSLPHMEPILLGQMKKITGLQFHGATCSMWATAAYCNFSQGFCWKTSPEYKIVQKKNQTRLLALKNRRHRHSKWKLEYVHMCKASRGKGMEDCWESNKVQERSDRNLCSWESGRETSIEVTCILFRENYIPLLPSHLHVHSFPVACEIICWIEIGIKRQFPSSFLLQCLPYIEGVVLVRAEACTRGLCMGFLCWRNLFLWLVTERACNWGKGGISSSFIFKIFFFTVQKDKLIFF